MPRTPSRSSLSRGRLGLLALLSLGATAAPHKQGFLGWSDAKFWANSTALDAKALEPFEASEFDGLVLDGPKRASLRQRPDVPLVAIRGASLRENSAIDLEARGVLVTSLLEGDETLALKAFRQPNKSSGHNKLSAPEPPEDPASLPDGRAVNLFHLVLSGEIPEVASHSGAWATTLLLFNQHSNQVVTRVEATPGRKAQGTVKGSGPSQRHPRVDVANQSYHARPDSPALAGNQAIALASMNTVVQAPGKAWLLRGSFLLPVLAHDLTSARPGHQDGDAKTVAVLPMTIVLTGDRDATPILVPLRVSIDQPLEGNQGQQHARGYFAVDLLALAGDQLSPQTYAIWAMSRSIISDPTLVKIVTQP